MCLLETIAHTLPCDSVVFDVMKWLLSGKMYGIFAILFGLSFFIMNDNQQQKDKIVFRGRFSGGWRRLTLVRTYQYSALWWRHTGNLCYTRNVAYPVQLFAHEGCVVHCRFFLLSSLSEIYSLLTGWQINVTIFGLHLPWWALCISTVEL